jgi:MFS family permease
VTAHESTPAREGASIVAPLSITVVMQMLTAYALHSASVYAPIVAPEVGVAPERVSIFVTFAYFTAMTMGLACSGFIARLGPMRTVQLGPLASGAGLAIGAVGTLPTMIVTAMLIGLGNGFTGPVSSHILVERTPRRMLSFVLSMKQTGVPIGGGTAGAVIPIAALAVGWRYSLLAAACVYLCVVLALQSMRADYDARRDRNARIGIASIVAQMKASLAMTWRDPTLRDLSIACFAFVGIQWIVLTFMVSLLHVRLGFPLVTAGLVYSAAQLTAIPGRLIWGAIADRIGNAKALLG